MVRRRHKTSQGKLGKIFKKCQFSILSLVTLLLILGNEAIAKGSSEGNFNDVGTLWLLIAGSLVFFMNAGFAMLETGFCRTRNAVNVLAKNLIVFCIATIAFWLFGFRFMYGDSDSEVFGQIGLLFNLPFPDVIPPPDLDNVSDLVSKPNPFPENFGKLQDMWKGRSFASLFFFQLVFAGTAATIVSGAVAERIKFRAFILFSFVLVGFIYPLTGYWVWGGGWLSSVPIQFRDFAGSTVVHSVGGMAAWIGAWLLKPRQNKFGYNPVDDSFSGQEDPERFEPHNLSLATLGCLILWLGWFGFNGGSAKYLEYVPHIITTTLFSAAAGGVATVLLSLAVSSRNVTLLSIINGILGGLVGITASSAYVDIVSAVMIGAISGLLVLIGENFLESLKIDDPVGAVPVHLFCGFWGTVAVGIFANPRSSEYVIENYSQATQTLYQFLGWIIVVVVVGILSLITWISIGILLHYLEQSSEKTSSQRMQGIGRSNTQDDGLFRLISDLWQIGRQGIRVSVEMEEKGSDSTAIS
ncbi:MAG: ammonium transporter [Symploca sp. SIO2E6]|nr:ammonium transporter [Symploca sp. SIO2E6]